VRVVLDIRGRWERVCGARFQVTSAGPVSRALSVRRGTGLGLSMVYELAKKMEAGLAVDSAIDQGSTFTLILPVRNAPAGSGS